MKEILHTIISKIVVGTEKVEVFIKGGNTFQFDRPPKRWNIDKYFED